MAEDDGDDEKEEKKFARLRIVSELLKPSVEVLCLHSICRSEAMDAIEACATVTQIQMSSTVTRGYFSPDDVQQKLQSIAMRNLELAHFVANPPGYPLQELLKLLSQFDSIPTGRYMLACGLIGIPSFFKTDESTESALARPKKKKKFY